MMGLLINIKEIFKITEQQQFIRKLRLCCFKQHIPKIQKLVISEISSYF